MRATSPAPFHRPFSHLTSGRSSFNILLNDPREFDGGHTRFEGLARTVPIGQGHVIIHSGKARHSGEVVTRGKAGAQSPNPNPSPWAYTEPTHSPSLSLSDRHPLRAGWVHQRPLKPPEPSAGTVRVLADLEHPRRRSVADGERAATRPVDSMNLRCGPGKGVVSECEG